MCDTLTPQTMAIVEKAKLTEAAQLALDMLFKALDMFFKAQTPGSARAPEMIKEDHESTCCVQLYT